MTGEKNIKKSLDALLPNGDYISSFTTWSEYQMDRLKLNLNLPGSFQEHSNYATMQELITQSGLAIGKVRPCHHMFASGRVFTGGFEEGAGFYKIILRNDALSDSNHILRLNTWVKSEEKEKLQEPLKVISEYIKLYEQKKTSLNHTPD